MQHLTMVLLAAVMLSGALPAFGDSDGDKQQAAATTKKKVKVFIFAGQSNMVGRSDPKLLPEEYRKPLPNIRLYSNQSWRGFGGPITSRNDGIGPEVSAGRLLSKALPDDEIILVKTAVGGTNLHTQWNPTLKRSLYHRMLKDVRKATAGRDVQVMAIFWAQGGGDRKTRPEAEAYGKNLTTFIAAARRDLGRKDLPFIFSMFPMRYTGPLPATGRRSFAAEVTRGKQQVAKTVPHTATVSTTGMSVKKDRIHYDTAGTIEFGRRFFEAWEKTFHRPADKSTGDSSDTPSEKPTGK